MSDVVRYGESIVLESCESSEHLFLSIVRRCEGRRSPMLLSTEVSESDKHPAIDYQWRMLPVVGSGLKWGDPVSFADRVRLQLVDDKGNSRMLAVSHLDNQSIMAERQPAKVEACTWWIAYTALDIRRDGRVAPFGDLAPHLEYGTANYMTLVNNARYLSANDDRYRILRKRTGLLDDLPETGTAVWWRVYRSTSDIVPPVRRVTSEAVERKTPLRSLSLV